MATTLWICTEERPKAKEIAVILDAMSVECDADTLKIRPTKDPFIFEADNVANTRVLIHLVSGTSSFPDYLVYRQETKPAPHEVPAMIMESTKSNIKESGNMWYQRLVKFVFFDAMYPGNTTKKVILYNTKLAVKSSRTSKVWDIGCRLCATLNVRVVLLNNDYAIDAEPYKTFEEMEAHINSTRSRANATSNRVFKKDGAIHIQSNLSKNGRLDHDPNKGFVVGLAAALRVVGETDPIVVVGHKLPPSAIDSHKLNNKFFYGLLHVGGVSIDGFDVDWSLVRLPESYFTMKVSGEKVVSIALDMLVSNDPECGLKVVFTNHAGCEKDYLRLNDKTITVPKSVQIPDICLEGKDCFYVLEAEQFKNAAAGVKQLDTFSKFVQLLAKECPTKTVRRDVILYGGECPHDASVFTIDKENRWWSGIPEVSVECFA